jgi:protein tyrosine phosphatase (PTP) superfamily phosphohydrolase (DUF442 family)
MAREKRGKRMRGVSVDESAPARAAAGSRRRRRRIAALGAAAALLASLVVFRNPLFHDNFGVVAPGLVYRAAQPGPELSRWVKTYGVASILNLRGGSPRDPAYANEERVTRTQGVAFYDFPMSATRRPSRRELLVLIDLFQRCRYPLLVHCKSGADRTGLASAVYLLVKQGEPPARALREFSLHYGHVPLLGPERLHEPLVEYDQWLEANRLTHTADRFRTWVEREYRSANRSYSFTPLPEGPRLQHRTQRDLRLKGKERSPVEVMPADSPGEAPEPENAG